MTSETQPGGGNGVHQRSDHPIYVELHDTPDFAELRSKFRRFVFPATFIFMAWYLLYVVMSNWANDFMSSKVVGNINIALLFGILQFVSTFVIAWLYGRYMYTHVDPLARKLNQRYEDEHAGGVA
ncbi:MAG: DUF485 domain-containing protein [Actinomycetota bacterium]|nr:DUF485 domain-containing protein [Actinomycetota bacterium]